MDKPSLEESLRTLAARRRSGEDHPAPEELVAYRAGGLTAAEDDRIQEHLTQCHACARLLLDLAEFEQLTTPPEELGPVDARAEASWQRLRSRLREEEEPAMEPPVLQHRPRPPVPLWRRPALPWALAAGLALCVAGLGLRMGSLRDEIGKLSAPSLNVPIEDLSIDADVRGESRTEEIPVLPGGGVLVLTPPAEATEYEVEVVSVADGALVIGPLRGPAVDGVLTLDIPLWFLSEGRYSARLYRILDGQRQPLEEYSFKISPTAP